MKDIMEVEYPSLVRRLQSTTIDYVFLLFTVFVLASLFENFGKTPDWVRPAFIISFIALYEPLCTTLGFTVGNYLCGIRVRRVDDLNNRINILQAFVRVVLKFSLGWISFITIHSSSKRRAIHDKVAGSVMIKSLLI